MLVGPISFYIKTMLKDRKRRKPNSYRDLEISLMKFHRCTSAET